MDPGTGLWFEEFTLGTRIQSRGRTITQGDVSSFAGTSGDFNPLHIDAVFAARTPFRKPVAHGMLVQSVATGMAYQTGVFDGTLQALAGMTIEWHAPVFPGDTIHIVLEVTGVDPAPKRRSGEIQFRASVHNQEDRLVSKGQWRTRVLRRSAARSAEKTR